MFPSKNKKNNVYPCKPQFFYIKMGSKGSKLYGHVFVMFFKESGYRLFAVRFTKETTSVASCLLPCTLGPFYEVIYSEEKKCALTEQIPTIQSRPFFRREVKRF